jgi:hypothetical protein
MKNKILKILGVVATVAMLSSFVVIPASAAGPGTNVWGEITLPKVMPVSAVDQMEIGPDGTLYVSVAVTSDGDPGDDIPDGGWNDELWTMYKSIDAGVTWTATKLDADKIGPDVRITAIAAAGNGMVYVATYDMVSNRAAVWKCPDKGDGEPFPLQALIDNQANPADYVYDLEVWTDGVSNWVMAAVHINNSYTPVLPTGEVLVLRDGLFEAWRDMDLSSSFNDKMNVDVGRVDVALKAKFAPDFNTSFMLYALISVFLDDNPDPGEGHYFVLTATGANSPGAWGTVIDDARFYDYDMDGDTGDIVDFQFAADFDGDHPTAYAALNDGGNDGNLFYVDFAFTADAPDVTEWVPLLEDDMGLCSVGIAPNFIIVGALTSNTLLISTNGADTFDEATKGPTGRGQVKIYLSNGYSVGSGDAIFCLTRRAAFDESAVSRSLDDGDTWNQIAFIDTTIDGVMDMTFSPDFPTGYMLLLTYSDVSHTISLWRSGNATSATPFWERVLCGTYSSKGNFDLSYDWSLVECSKDGSTVMLYNDYSVYRSSDDAQTFNLWRTTPWEINDWVVLDSVTFYAATDDGFYARSAFGPAKTALAGTWLGSIALQPGFAANDAAKDTLVVGGEDDVYVSTDSGSTFGAANDVGDGDVYVAFDQLNAAVIYYATGPAVGTATIGPTTAFPATAANMLSGAGAYKDSEDDTAAAAAFSGIWVSPDNTLYAIGGDPSTTGDSTLSDPVVSGGTLSLTQPEITDGGSASYTMTATPITVISGTFAEGTDAALTITGAVVKALSSTVAQGTVYVTDGSATGSFNIFIIDATAAFSSGDDLNDDDITVTSEDLTYTVTSIPGNTSDEETFLFRILIGEDDNIWETAQKDGAWGLWGTRGSNVVWTIAPPGSMGDTPVYDQEDYGDSVWALKDIMSGKVLGLNVTNITETSAKANWTAMTGATQYQVKWDTVANTTDSPVTATTTSTSSTMSPLTNNTKYTVKVRVTAGHPFQSRWSDSVEFTTLETVGAPMVLSPVNGQLNSPLNQTLNWTPVAGAKSYDVEVAASDNFSSPIVTANTANTIYHLANLAYNTDYAWRVRAVGATGAKGAWVISTFHTMAEAITPTTTIPTYTMTVDIPPSTQTTVIITQPAATSVVIPPATTFTQTITSQTVTAVVQLPDNAAPAYVWAIVAIGALLTLAVIILIIRTRRVV